MIRGVIEGFYGPPWTHEERLDLIRFCAAEGLDTWVHAPKDDPYHRERWREPYPEPEAERLAELAGAAQRFVYAIAPGLSIDYSSEGDFEALLAKREQVRALGAHEVQLLWDDIELTPNSGRAQ
ncbi:MAG TPA: beta-N-acetylglucosaminidase domain-containing protein, partial [Gaiellaceae bacterium]|nr:beta-N-acetylglucosaminidase domain-containing protein [Gaiellaceae bacterium]